MMLYARLARTLGRKPTFAIAFVLAFAATVVLFQGLTLVQASLLADADPWFLSARYFCTLRDLFPGTVSDQSAQHWHVVLL